MEFFYRLKRIINKHSKIAKVYLSSLTLLLVCCITFGLVAFAVPFDSDDRSSSPFNKDIVEIADDAETPGPTEAPTEAPTETPEPTEDPDEGESEMQAEIGAKPGSIIERTPSDASAPDDDKQKDPAKDVEKTPEPTKEPEKDPEPTPEPTPTPVPQPERSLKWKDVPEKVEYGVRYVEDDTLAVGQTRVVSEGEYGIKTTVWEITLVDGVEESRKIVAVKDTKAPVDKVVAVGTIDSFVDNQGRVMGLSKRIIGDATAYGNSVKWGNAIYYGSQLGGLTTRWGVIAVDPNVIPLGTKVYVKCGPGVNDYGYAIAGDIGGAIKGTRIDLWMDNREIIKIWGVRDVEIYILADQSLDVFELRGADKWIPPAKYNYVDPNP